MLLDWSPTKFTGEIYILKNGPAIVNIESVDDIVADAISRLKYDPKETSYFHNT